MTLTRMTWLLLATAALSRTASADFLTPGTPPWTRPASTAAASSSKTTFQIWNGFAATTAAAPPSIVYNPNLAIATSASDSTSATDGAFIIGTPRGDIYSFSDVIHPHATVAGYGISGNNLNVLVEVQSFGTIDNSPGLLVNGVSASTLPGYSYAVLSSTPTQVGTPSGTVTLPIIDHTWQFTLADAASFQLDWSWGGVSIAFQDLSIDTQSVPAAAAPEPASLSILALGAGLLLRKRRMAR